MSDKRFGILLIALVLFAVIAGVLIALLVPETTKDSGIILSTRDLEVRAVCTADSGLIVTTWFNARIAGDSMMTVRMTPAEVAQYCSEGSP